MFSAFEMSILITVLLVMIILGVGVVVGGIIITFYMNILSLYDSII